MFDFPHPGEIYRSAGFPDVAVVGILEDGIPWEMPYRCPDIVWNPYRRKFSILVRILAAYFHERRSLNNFHRDRVITFEQIAE
ncbi:hypothetical protein EYZ63_003126 [Escherichia coli]|nr:hypothetical protein [Escherichia coli]